MKKTIVIVLAALIALSSLFAQGANEAASSTTKIVVGATPEPHAALLSLVVDDLADIIVPTTIFAEVEHLHGCDFFYSP